MTWLYVLAAFLGFTAGGFTTAWVLSMARLIAVVKATKAREVEQ